MNLSLLVLCRHHHCNHCNRHTHRFEVVEAIKVERVALEIASNLTFENRFQFPVSDQWIQVKRVKTGSYLVMKNRMSKRTVCEHEKKEVRWTRKIHIRNTESTDVRGEYQLNENTGERVNYE